MTIGEKREKIQGHLHPLTHTLRRAEAVFRELGFSVADGPHIETAYYNFDALNIPADHPARDLWDTFWLKPEHSRMLLRTHTSPVQVRYMENHTPPLRIIVPGKVFRHEATDATHEAQFHQIEGLAIGKDISLAHLKGTMETFFSGLMGRELSVRLRPSFFPFVEPGVEIDVECFKCKSDANCSVCKGTGFVEVLGAGMVHPNVLKAGGIDAREWRGFAFGMGLDRLTMLTYGIDDIRRLYSGDLRVINQF